MGLTDIDVMAEAFVLFGSMPLDANGHFCHGDPERLKGIMPLFLAGASPSLPMALTVFKAGAQLHEPMVLSSSSLLECDECGKSPNVLFDGVGFVMEPCPNPRGLPAIEFELNVPSGQIVVTDDLRDWFPITGRFNLDSKVECKLTSEVFAKLGLAHAYVGNSDPSVYRVNKRSYTVGTKAPKKGAKKVAKITTKLHWFSFCDYSNLSQLTGGVLPREIQIVDVEPGVYKFTHKFFLAEDRWERRTFTTFEWLRPADEATDLQAAARAKNLTAEQILFRYVEDWGWKTERPIDDLIRGACQLLCTLAGGYEYHPNGWLGSNPLVSEDDPELPIPVFSERFHWSLISDHSWLACMGGVGGGNRRKGNGRVFNESFVRLGFNIVASIIRYGADVSWGDDRDTPEQLKAREEPQIRWAWHIYLGLSKRYPQWVPDYAVNLPKPKIDKIDILPR